MKPHLISGGDGMGRPGVPMIALPKVLIAVLTASLISGSALVALTGGVGPGGGSDYGLDTDGDGLYDWLVVTMDLSVDEADYYNVWATLGTKEPFARGCDLYGPMPLLPEMPTTRCGPDGRCADGDPVGDFVYPISWASVREFLEAGDHTVNLAFRGTDIGLAGVDGPYEVQAFVSSDGGATWDRGVPQPGTDPGILPPVPEGWTWEYTTGAYAAADFEQPTFAIRFTGTYADEGLDLDADGLFDYLVVTADVDVSLAGAYWFEGSLSVPFADGEPNREYYWFPGTYGTVDLEEGAQTLEFRVNGGEIWATGHDGAFDFRLSVSYGGGIVYGYPDGTIREGPMPEPTGEFDLYGDTLCGRTAEYRHDAWEELVEPIVFTGVFADRGEDWDGDGLFDVLALDAEVDVTEAGFFEVSGQLMSEDASWWIAMDYQQFSLEPGVQTVTLHFSGPMIRASGIDGPYRADLYIATYRAQQATYTTGAYAHTDFDEDDPTRPQTHWIADLSADASAITVLVVRGDDMLTVVIEDTLLVEAYAADGTAVFAAREKVYLPSGGDTQSFTFEWSPEPGSYVVRASLETTGNVVEILVLV